MAKTMTKTGRLANLKPFPPGVSGNLRGRGKGVKDKVPRTFKVYAAEICKDPHWQEKIRRLPETGNAKAIEAILYYGEGKPVETHEVRVTVAHAEFTPEQLRQIAEAYIAGA